MAEPIARDFAHLTRPQLTNWLEQARRFADLGHPADRIPQLARVNSHWLAVQIHRYQQENLVAGDATDHVFTLMSVVKPLLLLYLLDRLGTNPVRQFVGTVPSTAAFHSLDQLIADGGRPRNPMINSGAITLAGQLPGSNGTERCQALCHWLNQRAGCHLTLDTKTLASVRATGYQRNRAIAHHLKEAGYLEDVELALDTYNQICCLAGTVADLAQLGTLLAFETSSIARSHRQFVNALMLSCGLYEASSEFSIRIGLPIKSGISGALLAVVPNQGSIACYSPALDKTGNPIAGLSLIERLSGAFQLSLFS